MHPPVFRRPGSLATAVFAISLACSASTASGGTPRTYHNVRWNFCVAHPAGWTLYEGFNKAGGRFSIPAQGRETAFIDVGALPDGPGNLDSDEPMSLQANVDMDMDFLQHTPLEPTKNVRFVKSSNRRFLGFPAISYAVAMEQRGEEQREERIIFIKNGALYSLRLHCRSRDLASLEPIFQRTVKSFQLRCGRPNSL
jgi:hypothetical protein